MRKKVRLKDSFPDWPSDPRPNSLHFRGMRFHSRCAAGARTGVSLGPGDYQMDTTTLLLWIHIVAFVAGGSNTVVMPIIGTTLPMVDEATRATLFRIGFQMATIGKVAAATLLITGPLLLWLKYGGLQGATLWFWIKMVLIVALFAAIAFEEANFKKLASGDRAAARKSKLGGMIATVAFLGVLLAAVQAFK